MRRHLLRLLFAVTPALLCVLDPTSASAQQAEAPPVKPADAVQPQAETPPAAAAPKVESGDGRAPTERVWVGYRSLMADGASALAVVLGDATDSVRLTRIGLAGLGLGAPIVHAAYGPLGTAGLSLALRVGMPAVGFGIGYALGDKNCAGNGSCLFSPAWDSGAIGVAVGLVGAIAVDASVLSWEERPLAHPASTPAVLSVSPAFDPRTKTAAVTMLGQF